MRWHTRTGDICPISPVWSIGLARGLSHRNPWSGSRFRSKTCPSGKRWRAARHLPAFEMTKDAESLTQAIMQAGILPPYALGDAAHVAVAAVHGINYLLTWNCKHLANAQIARRIGLVCEKLGHRMPIICTPEELMGA